MSTGLKWKRMSGALFLGATLLCAASWADSTAHTNKKTKKPPLPPISSGPMGPVQQVPLDSLTAIPPQVSFQNNQLTIVAPNSTLADILRAVRKQTGAEIEVPAAPERVVTHLGPGPAREVMAELLNGSRFNYVLLGSAADDAVLTRVVLVTKKQEALAATNPPGTEPAPGAPQAAIAGQPPQEADQNDPDGEETADENAEPAAETQPAPQDQQPPISPQQRMQEMQQRQMQLQQMQQPGQPPVPGPGIPPRPQPQEQ
jgi:hypothetical protein